MSDHYEFVPQAEFATLEKELDTLKKSPLLNQAKGKQLEGSLTRLQDSVDALNKLFQKANEDLTLEEREEKILFAQLEPLKKKIEEISEQNQIIANGIVTVADSINELKSMFMTMQHQQVVSPQPFQQNFPPPMEPLMPPPKQEIKPNSLNKARNFGSLFSK